MTIPATDYGELGLVLHNFGGMLTSIKIQIYDRQQKENTNKKRVKWAGSNAEQNRTKEHDCIIWQFRLRL
jgi:hypothetical protein